MFCPSLLAYCLLFIDTKISCFYAVCYAFYRPTCSNIAKVHIWHGGVFVRNPIIGYSNGECVIESRWDIDEINSIEVAKKVKLLGYLAFNVWYKHPSLDIAKLFKD